MSKNSIVTNQSIPKYSSQEFWRNFNQLINESKVSISEIHRNTGLPITTLQRLKIDPNSNPTLATLVPIAEFFAVSVSQLIGDESLPIDRSPGIFIQRKENWIKIPILSWEQATAWPNIEIDKKQATVSTDIDIGGNTFALEIMEDDWAGFPKNSLIIVDPNINPSAKDYLVVHKAGIRVATLKKFVDYEGAFYLAPLNDNFRTVPYNEEYRILGVVVQIRKDIRK
jgi:SOS-response transcriptional repressor LexA